MAIIYKVDTDKEVTPEMARDAIVECFYDAHCSQTEISNLEEDYKLNKSYCEEIVRKAFLETKGDYDHPTKNSLLATLPWLAEFSKIFRDQETIKKHMTEVLQLINLIKE